MILATAEDTAACGQALAARLRPGDVVTLSGALGAGKTVFARGLLAGLGWVGEVPSPSYPLVIPYDPPAVRLPLLHADLYRIEEPSEIAALALDEALGDGAVAIEWPERLGPEGWPGALALRLEASADGARRLTARVPPAWEARWPPRR